MKIVFLGTPDFSVPCLSALINSKHEVLAVVTQLDKARNRMVVSFSPVKEEALKNNIKVLQYEKIRQEGVLDLKELNPDVMVTCAYGQIISQEILDIPKYGVINVHASLLPKYRGSSPIQWSVINGDKETGISIMQTSLGIDCGDIILQKNVSIGENETAGELFDKLAKIAPDVLLKALDLIENKKVQFKKQDDNLATHCVMLKKEDGKIDWNKNAKDIKNLILGLDPWPSAYSFLNGKIFKLFKAEVSFETFNDKKPGDIVIKDKKNVFVVCGENSIKLKDVQLEGKKKMDIETFLLGYDLNGASLQ